MDKRQDRPREFVADVKSGISDLVLQRKYGLSKDKFLLYKASALDIIAQEATREFIEKRKINPHSVLSDIESGMDDNALMIRYNLNPRQLQSILRQIIDAGLVSAVELSGRLSITKSQVRDAFVEMGKTISKLD